MAASVREAFSASVRSILALLRFRGILQKDIADALGIFTSQISRWKDGTVPEPEMLDAFIAFANRHLPESEQIEPDDLFRGDHGYQTAKRN